MDKVKEFFSKPKHLYFSVMLAFILVLGLASVTFSYVDESANEIPQAVVAAIDTRISSEYLKDGKLSLKANEAKTITLYVMSNNVVDTKYKLHYDAKGDVRVTADELRSVIGPGDVHFVTMEVANYNNYPVDVTIGLATSYLDSDIVVTGKSVVMK